MALISINSLSVPNRLQGVGLALQEGEMLGLLGPNGAGKSTLLNALAGTIEFAGELYIESQPAPSLTPEQRAQTMGLLPQNGHSAWPLKVVDLVALGRLPWGDEDRQAITQAMVLAEVESYAERRVDQLSAGERARVMLARVVAGTPRVLLADEPVAALDIHFQIAVMNMLQRYAREGHGVVVAIHDLSLAARFCDRLILLNRGEMVHSGTPQEVLTESLLSAVYDVVVDVDLQRYPPLVIPH